MDELIVPVQFLHGELDGFHFPEEFQIRTSFTMQLLDQAGTVLVSAVPRFDHFDGQRQRADVRLAVHDDQAAGGHQGLPQ